MRTINYFEKYEREITNSEPIHYNNKIWIYPIKWRDSFDFLSSYDVLIIEKDNIPIAEIISMSYLKFLLTIIQEDEDDIWSSKFRTIMKICFNIDALSDEFIINMKENGSIYLSYKDIVITERDFEQVRKIIMYQNIFDYDDSYIDPDVKKSIETFYKIASGNIVQPSLEKQKIILMSNGFSKNDVMDMTYRESVMLLSTINDKIEYITDKIIRCIPYIDGSKIKINHWIYNTKKNKYDEAFVDAEAFKGKFENVT